MMITVSVFYSRPVVELNIIRLEQIMYSYHKFFLLQKFSLTGLEQKFRHVYLELSEA